MGLAPSLYCMLPQLTRAVAQCCEAVRVDSMWHFSSPVIAHKSLGIPFEAGIDLMGPTVFGRCARQRTRAPRSGASWCGQLVAKKGKIARLPSCLIGGEVDVRTKNDRI